MPQFSEDTQHDFRFVKNIRAADVNGSKTMVDKTGRMLNAGLYITETQFLQQWATMFAIGNVGGRNYFDATRWMNAVHKMNNATRTGLTCVVTNDEKTEILFVIKPISEAQFTDEERRSLSDVHSFLVNARNAADAERMKAQMNEGALYLHDSVHDKISEYHEMIPAEWWKKHNIYPVALQQAVYMRDTYGVINENFDLAYAIFIKMQKQEPVTEAEKAFILESSNNEFSFDDYTPSSGNEESKKEQGGQSNRISPFEC